MPTHNPASRPQQAYKIYNLLADASSSQDNNTSKICLDVGCGSGEIMRMLAEKFRLIVGIEIDINAIRVIEEVENSNARYSFTQADGANLPFENDSFDYIICAQVYEHTIDQLGLMDEIWRVLKSDGICFFSGPNKYTILEEHYFLPFLSWLPPKIANFYVKLFKRNYYYDIYPLSYRNLKRLLEKFQIEDATLNIFQNPERYGMENRYGIFRLLKYIPKNILKPFFVFIPNFNLLLRKY